MKKRVLSILLVLVMIFGIVPVQAFALDNSEYDYEIGAVVENSNTEPTGTIPPETEWESEEVSVLTCTKSHSRHSNSCYTTTYNWAIVSLSLFFFGGKRGRSH